MNNDLSINNSLPVNNVPSANKEIVPGSKGASFQEMLEAAQTKPTQFSSPSSSGLGNNMEALVLSALLGNASGGEYGPLLSAILLEKALGGQSDFSSISNLLASDFSQQIDQSPLNSAYGTGNAPVLELAFSRLGHPYSQEKAGQANYTDCSYLSQWCYRQQGINLPRTAAEQAKHCVDNGYTIGKENLQPGDLVFFSNHKNGRYMDITHVAIYAGNGMIVDASSSNGKVVHRELFGGQVLYARPR